MTPPADRRRHDAAIGEVLDNLVPTSDELLAHTARWAEVVRHPPGPGGDLAAFRDFAERDYFTWIVGFAGDVFAQLARIRRVVPGLRGTPAEHPALAGTAAAIDTAAFHLLQRHSIAAAVRYAEHAAPSGEAWPGDHLGVVRAGLAFDALPLIVTEVFLTLNAEPGDPAVEQLQLSLGMALFGFDLVFALWELPHRLPDANLVVLPLPAPPVPAQAYPLPPAVLVAGVPDGPARVFRIGGHGRPSPLPGVEVTDLDLEDLYPPGEAASGTLAMRHLLHLPYERVPADIDSDHYAALQREAESVTPPVLHGRPDRALERFFRRVRPVLFPPSKEPR